VAVVPGITAMQALAAASLTPLVEGQESLTLVPATAGLEAVGVALETSDTVVAYKGGRQLAELLRVVHEHGRDGVLGVNIGLPGQVLTPLAEVTVETAPYFSTVLVAPTRTETGGRL
ncbi:MAG TPA: precorrin-2 C(20)-methyltransferase, partial [Propionibacteriaceae bacterium]|nr:precorrin-2 C(20)-methyltransferase [Propionibacteriaceae bacterium]